MMEAERISETSVYCYETAWRNIPEGCHLHIRRRENLKSHSRIVLPFMEHEASLPYEFLTAGKMWVLCEVTPCRLFVATYFFHLQGVSKPTVTKRIKSCLALTSQWAVHVWFCPQTQVTFRDRVVPRRADAAPSWCGGHVGDQEFRLPEGVSHCIRGGLCHYTHVPVCPQTVRDGRL
jgi:hypothetical protein